MNTSPELLDRILSFPIDEGTPALSFERRLARENGWTPGFAARVVREYKRFVYLAMTAGHQVTPSDQVDQAWHLHLTYTRSYWERLCGEVLGRPLHHGPTRGGPAEAVRFDRQYEQTLDAYRAAFGEAPPADVWPPSAVRFGDDLHFARVNTARNWVVPKAAVKRGVALAAVALGAAFFATGCDPRLNPFALVGLNFLWFYVPLVLAAAVFGLAAQLALSGPGPQPHDDDPQLDWADAAYLAGGKHRLVSAAIARLAAAGRVRVTADGRTLEPHGTPDGLSPVEAVVFESLPLSRDNLLGRRGTAERAETAFAPRAAELVTEGYEATLWRRCGRALVSVSPLAFVVGFGLPRWAHAAENNLPRGALGTVLVLAALGCFILLVAAFHRQTRRGANALSRLRRSVNKANPAAAGMAVAVSGPAALAACGAADVAAVAAWYPRPSAAGGGCGTGCGSGGSDGGGGGGDGGGCGGGGCGGCGGCGG